MDSVAQPKTAGQVTDLGNTLINLGNVPLGQLARRFADGDAIVVGVVSRITGDREAPSRLRVMSFSSSI